MSMTRHKPRERATQDRAGGRSGGETDIASLAQTALLPGDAETFRRFWRGFGSTVALVATGHGVSRHAMLATAVSSVSMDPPSLLVCINRSASAHAALRERGAFSLGIMGSEARKLASAIAQAPSASRFAHGAWSCLRAPDQPIDGLPWLQDAQATLFCTIETCVDYGTHAILIARIAAAIGTAEADPLLYCNGSYGRFTSAGS